MNTTERIIFERIKKDYERDIVDLKTKNEIFEIEKQASSIHFNTSFIEQKIEEKNQTIAMLEGENNKLKMELDFYHNSRAQTLPTKEESLFMTNLSNIQHKQSFGNQNFTNNTLNITGLNVTTKEDKDSFKRYIEMGKKVNNNLKNDLEISEKRKA